MSGGQVPKAVQAGRCNQGIILWWTVTGISIAANKIRGIRAALCIDAKTAEGARLWNKANVLALSNRLLSPTLTKDILDAWFSTTIDAKSTEEPTLLSQIEND